jgi:hypothetical protein
MFTRKVGNPDMLNSVLISIGMCLNGGEQVDISKYILPTVSPL